MTLHPPIILNWVASFFMAFLWGFASMAGVCGIVVSPAVVHRGWYVLFVEEWVIFVLIDNSS